MIKENVKRILEELPPGVQLVGAAKGRMSPEILEAIEGGLEIVGENYLQEALRAFEVIGEKVKWHFIGHLQKNKVKKAVKLFDLIETVDSLALAQEIDKAAGDINKVMPILIEVNSGQESQKFGVIPDEVEKLIKDISGFSHIKVMGLMTMGPLAGAPDDFRPYFSETKKTFEKIKSLNLPNVEMKYLSMGMSNSYRVAIEEGANLVRIGTKIFGERKTG